MQSEATRQNLDIIVADDDLLFLQQMNDAFEYTGHQIRTVNSRGSLACMLYGEVLPDIIFIDLSSPPTTAIESLKFIKQHQRWRHIPVLIYSDIEDDEIAKKAYELGAESFFEKPSTYQKLVDEIIMVADYWQQQIRPKTT